MAVNTSDIQGKTGGNLTIKEEGGTTQITVVDGATGPRFEGSIKIKAESGAATDTSGYGQLWVNSSNNELYWTNQGGDDVKMTNGTSTAAASSGSSAAADDITTGDAAVNLTTSSGNITVDSNAGSVAIDGHTGVTITSSDSGEVDITSAANVDINATTGVTIDGTTISIDGTDDVNLTVTSSTAGEDLTIQQIGGNDSSIIITAAGTGTDAISIDATAGDMVIAPSLADGKTLKLGKNGAVEMVFTPHGTAGNEKFLLTNTAGTADDAIKMTSVAGGVTIHAGNDSLILDADGTDADAINIDSAGGVDLDAAGAVAIDSSAGSITIGAILADGQTLKLGKNGAVETTIAPHGTAGSEIYSVINTAGTTDGAEGEGAILLESVAGGIGLHGADDKDIWVEAGQVVLTANHDTAAAIKIHADAGSSQTIQIINDAGTTDGSEGAGAIDIEATVGGISLHAADDKDIAIEAGQVVLTANHDTAAAIKIHADTGTSQTIQLLNDAGTTDGSEGAGAIDIEATVGGISLHAADDKDIWIEAGQTIITANHDTAGAIKLHADVGSSQTIQLLNDAGTASTAIDIEATAGGFSIDGVQASNITVASAGDADDLTISVTGANDASLILASAGTGTDAMSLDVTAGDMVIAPSLADGKTLKIGKNGAVEMVFTPHGTAGNEKFSLVNTSGTADDAIKIDAEAGGVTIAAGNDSLILDADGTDADAINIDSAGGIDIDAADEINIATTSADGHIALVSAHTSGLAFHIDANADAASEVQIDAGVLDIDVTGASTLNTTLLTITDTTTSSATEGGKLRLTCDDGAAMADDHRLGVIEFAGAEDNSSTITVGARIEAICDAAWSSSENGAALVMYTTDANASQSEVLRLDSNKLADFQGDITMGGLLKIDVDADADDATGDSATGRLAIGAGEDLNLYHGGSHSYIVNDTGNLNIVTAGDLVVKNSQTGDDKPAKLTLQSNEGAVTAQEVIGQIDFQAAGETGTDAIKVCASIIAAAEAEFDASNNKTALMFYTAQSEAATEEMETMMIGSAGVVTLNSTIASSTTAGATITLVTDDGAAMGDTHRLGAIEFKGAEDGSSNYQTGAKIEAVANISGGWSASQNGTDLKFSTMTGNAASSVVMKIDHVGDTSIYAASNSGTATGGTLNLVQDDGAAMADTHILGKIHFQGAEDGSSTLQAGAKIEAVASAGWSASENATDLKFYTMSGNASSDLSLTLASGKNATFAGNVLLSAATPIIEPTNASGTDTAGNDLTIHAGAGTGTGAGGSIIFKGAEQAGSTGSSVNAHNALMTLKNNGELVLTRGTATNEAPGGGFNASNVVTSTVQKINNIIVTTFMLNIGAGGISSDATANGNTIGENGQSEAYFGKLTKGKNGVIYKATMACVQAPTTGEPDLDLYGNTNPVAEGGNAASGTNIQVIDSNGDWTVGRFKESMSFASGMDNYYLYLSVGQNTPANSTAGTYDEGKFIITFYGSDDSW